MSSRNTSKRGRASSSRSRASGRGSNARSGSSRGSRNAGRATSVRIGDLPSGRRRMQRAPLWASPWFARVLIALGVLVVLALGMAALSATSLFPINQVAVTGVSHLTEAEMTELAAVPSNTTLLRVDTAAIEERLKSNPWVESATVHRALPGTLELHITERTIAAVVEVPVTEQEQSQDWAIASDGTWLTMIPPQGTPEAATVSAHVYEDAARVLHITDLPYGVNPQEGVQCDDASVVNALDIVSGLSTDLAGQVSIVSATDTANTMLTLDSGVQVAFGAAESIREKERVCLELLASYPGQIAYINVRVVDKPTWRAVS